MKDYQPRGKEKLTPIPADDPLRVSEEEAVIREWVEAMTRGSGAPLPPSLRRAEPLPRRRVLPVVQTLLEVIDDLRAALQQPARPEDSSHTFVIEKLESLR